MFVVSEYIALLIRIPFAEYSIRIAWLRVVMTVSTVSMIPGRQYFWDYNMNILAKLKTYPKTLQNIKKIKNNKKKFKLNVTFSLKRMKETHYNSSLCFSSIFNRFCLAGGSEQKKLLSSWLNKNSTVTKNCNAYLSIYFNWQFLAPPALPPW